MNRETDSIDLQPTRLPSAGFLVGFFFLTAMALVHFLALTAKTNNLDDIKYATLLCGGAGALIVFCTLALQRSFRMPPRIIIITYLAYIVAMVVSTLLGARDYSRWVGWQMIAMQVSLTGFFLLATVAIPTVRLVRMSVRFWVIVAWITCGFGLLHYVGGLEGIASSLEAQYQAGGGGEPSGFHMLMLTFAQQREMLSTILNTQFFGNFLSLVLPITLAGIIANIEDARGKLENGEPIIHSVLWVFLSFCAAFLAAICMFLTFSKSTWIALFVVLVLFFAALIFILRYNPLKLPAWPVGLVLVLILAGTVLLFSYSDLVAQMSEIRNSVGSRSIIWKGAIDMWLDRPVFGGGPGSFRVDFPIYRSPDYHLSAISNVTLYAHNWVLDLLAESGVVGVLTFFAFLLGVLIFGVKAIIACKDGPLRAVMIGYIVGIIGLYVGNLFTPMIRWPIGLVTAYVGLGLLVGVAKTMTAGNIETPREHHFTWNGRRIAAAVGIAVSVLWLFIAINLSHRYFTGSFHNNEGLVATNNADKLAREYGTQYLDQQWQLLEKASEELETAIEYNPTFLTSYYKLGFVYNRLGFAAKQKAQIQLQEAQGDGLTQVEVDAVRELYERSMEYQRNALATYESLREYAPDYSEVQLNTAILAMTMGNDLLDMSRFPATSAEQKKDFADQAVEMYGYAAEAIDQATEQSNKISVHFLAGRVHTLYAQSLPEDSPERREQVIAAADAYKRTRELPFSVFIQESNQKDRERDERRQAATLAARFYQQAEAWERAAMAYEYLAEISTGSGRNWELAAMMWLRADKKEEASRVVEAALERNPLNADVLLLRAGMLLESKNGNAAAEVRYLERLNEELPNLFNDEQLLRLEQLAAQLNPQSNEPAAAS